MRSPKWARTEAFKRLAAEWAEKVPESDETEALASIDDDEVKQELEGKDDE